MRRTMRGALWGIAVLAACSGEKDPPADSGTPDTESPETTPSTGAARVETILSLTGDSAAGEETYQRICAACHAADGSGSASGPALTERVPLLSEEEIVTTILEGKGNMDAYDTLTNPEIADLLAHLLASFASR